MPVPPRILIAGNWKMHGTSDFAAGLAGAVAEQAGRGEPPGPELLLCPPAPLLAAARAAIGDAPVALGGQDCHPRASGAHTGDVSAEMLADAGCSYVIVGHSERRADHGEDDALVRDKAAAAQAAGLVPIVCVGETLAQREAGRAEEVVVEQLSSSLPPEPSPETVVVAYEPVWAIGTGLTPTLADIAEIHARIRGAVAPLATRSEGVRVLYGGSVKSANAGGILATENVDGVLVGGASLEAESFRAIAASGDR